VQEGVVGIGTEVVIESEERTIAFWILGEDEQHHGAGVISFQSTVGRALVGKSIGDEVELDIEGARRRYRIASVARKIPAAEVDEPHPSA
jgi:transcription elongation factor GreA